MTDASQPRSRISQCGLLFSAAAVVMFLFGMARTDGSLACLALLALILVPLSYAVGKRNLRHREIRCHSSKRAVVGQPFPVSLEIQRGPAIFAAREWSIKIDLLGGSTHQMQVERIEAAAITSFQQHFSFSLRGELRRLTYRVESTFPFGFWSHSVEGEIPHFLTVIPRVVVPKKLRMLGWWSEGDVMSGLSHPSSTGEIRGLRAWRAGDSLKRIHPAASVRAYASGGGLMVADMDPPGFSPRHVTVLFHSYAADRAIIRPEMFERALSYLCGTLKFLSQQSIPVSVVADFDAWLEQSCRNRSELKERIDHLATVQRHRGTELHELQRALREVEPRSSLIVISDMPLASWRSVFSQRDAPVIFLPISPSTQRSPLVRHQL
jgi:uncharacterized protein (DUF58 family)